MKTWLSNLKTVRVVQLTHEKKKKEQKKQTKSVKDPSYVCDSGLVDLNGTNKKQKQTKKKHLKCNK